MSVVDNGDGSDYATASTEAGLVPTDTTGTGGTIQQYYQKNPLAWLQSLTANPAVLIGAGAVMLVLILAAAGD